MTETLKGGYAELRRCRAIAGLEVTSTTQGGLIAQTIREKWMRKARILRKEVTAAREIQVSRPPVEVGLDGGSPAVLGGRASQAEFSLQPELH